MTTPALASTHAVCAIVVAWQSELPLLDTVIQSVRSQVGGVVVVDHGSQCVAFASWMDHMQAQGVVCLRHLDNPGLAAGFNRGIEYARTHGFGFVMLLDQDSVIADEMVPTLLEGYHALSAHARVAVVGPQFIDRRTGLKAPFVRFGFPFNRKIKGGPGQRIGCDFLISSGSLIPIPVLDQVGMMDETLFIDNIDMDWCMRASAQGYTLYGICDATMQHAIGQRILPSRWHPGGIAIHSPTRQYYFTRNRVLLYRRPHVPWVWVAQDVLRLVGKTLRMSLLVAPRRAHIRAIWHGICDGLHRRGGRRPGAGA